LILLFIVGILVRAYFFDLDFFFANTETTMSPIKLAASEHKASIANPTKTKRRGEYHK